MALGRSTHSKVFAKQLPEGELIAAMLIPCSFPTPSGATLNQPNEDSGPSTENSADDPWAMVDIDEGVEGEVSSALSTELQMDEDLEEDSQNEDDDEVERIIAEGEAMTRDGDNRGALALFNKAISMDPGAEMAWFNRGVILEAQGDAKSARQAFVITLDLNPEHGPAAANLAIILDRMGDSQGAKRWAEVALESFPGHHLLMKLLQKGVEGGIVADASETEMRIMGQAQTSEAAPERAELVWSEDDVSDAMEAHGIRDREAVLEEARLHDSDGNLYLDREELHSAAGLVAAKKAAVEEAEVRSAARIEEAPAKPEGPNLDALCEQAKGLLRSGDAKGSLSMLMEHLHGAAAQHAESWRVAAGAMARLDLNDNAIDAFNHSLGLDDSDASGWYNLGAIHRRKNENIRAQECFSKALELRSDYSRAAHSLATTCLENGDIEGTLEAWRKLLEIEPQHDSKSDFANLLVELAEGEAQVLEMVEGIPPTIPEGPHLAEEALRHIDEESPLKARALSAAGKHTESVLCWKELLKVNKDEASYWLGLSKALIAAGDEATAARCRTKYEELGGGSREISLGLDDANQSLASPVVEPVPEPVSNTVPEVVEAPAPAINIVSEPDSLLTPIEPTAKVSQDPEPEPQVDLSKVAMDAKEKVAAESQKVISTISTAVANQDVEWYNKGLGLLADKKYSQALSCFDKALPMFTHDDSMIIRILNARGNCFYYLEDYPKCIENHHKAMVIDPSSVTGATLYNMGTAYGEMERYEDAIKCFEQSIPRGLTKEQQKLAKEQVRRCNLLNKEKMKKAR